MLAVARSCERAAARSRKAAHEQALSHLLEAHASPCRFPDSFIDCATIISLFHFEPVAIGILLPPVGSDSAYSFSIRGRRFPL